MFGPDVRLRVAAIMAGAAYRALEDKTIDDTAAESVIDGVLKYVGKCSPEEQMGLRLQAIRLGRRTASYLEVKEEYALTAVQHRNLVLLIGRTYPTPIMRRIATAIYQCTEASEKGYYFGYIDVSKKGVFIAVLPWAWGWTNWTWQFKEKTAPSSHRDYFLIAAN